LGTEPSVYYVPPSNPSIKVEVTQP
jgi:hypothetical protein